MTDGIEAQLVARLFLDTLVGPELSSASLTQSGSICTATLAGQSLAVAVANLSSAVASPGWTARVDTFADLVAGDSQPAVLLWMPPGADVLPDEPTTATMAQQFQEVLTGLPPGARADVGLPATLALQKRDEQGAYVSASGGLAAQWARFTDRVKGYYQIDSTALHRLPAEPNYLESLIGTVVETSTQLNTGQIATVAALDHWLVQRLQDGIGCAMVAAPPEDDSEAGAPLRRRLRAVVRAASTELAPLQAAYRVLLLVGHFTSQEGEPAGPALRGMDPALFAGLDLVALAADGEVRALIDITRRPALQLARPAAAQ